MGARVLPPLSTAVALPIHVPGPFQDAGRINSYGGSRRGVFFEAPN